MKPQLEKLIKLIQLSKEGPTKGKELEDWQIEFQPLQEITEQDIAATESSKQGNAKLLLETLKLMSEMQLADTSDIREYLKDKTELPIAEGKLDLKDAAETEEQTDIS